jgi:hypothetical protein
VKRGACAARKEGRRGTEAFNFPLFFFFKNEAKSVELYKRRCIYSVDSAVPVRSQVENKIYQSRIK